MPDETTTEPLTIRIPLPRKKSAASNAMDVDGRHSPHQTTAELLTGSFVEPQAESSQAYQPLVVAKEYCSFCGDMAVEKVHVCKDCGAYVCEQTKRHGRGCIYMGTVLPTPGFRCPVCNARHWRGLSSRPNGGLPVSDTAISAPNLGATGRAAVRLHRLCRQEAGEANLAPCPGQHDALHQCRELPRRFSQAGPQAHLSGSPTERESSENTHLSEKLNAW